MEDLVQVNVFLYNIDFADGAENEELARGSVVKHPNTIRRLRYNSHNCYVSDINVLFKEYCSPSRYTFLNRAPDLELHLTTCRERVKYVNLKNVNKFRGKL